MPHPPKGSTTPLQGHRLAAKPSEYGPLGDIQYPNQLGMVPHTPVSKQRQKDQEILVILNYTRLHLNTLKNKIVQVKPGEGRCPEIA